jgi:ATP-dependent RNA helicase DDX52/ROK1
MIACGLQPPVLVFVATKERAKQLYEELKYENVHCDYLSAHQSQSARTHAVENFRAGKTWMLIATDLIGRGMDFLGVNTVINYDFPGTTTEYIHRYECFQTSWNVLCACFIHVEISNAL